LTRREAPLRGVSFYLYSGFQPAGLLPISGVTNSRIRMKMAKIDEILEDFSYLEDWEDRYRYVIELGKALPDLPDSDKNADNKVRGCASQVWLVSDAAEGADPVMTFRGDSDAHIVRGLVAIVLALYSGRRASEIAGLDALETFRDIGLVEHLSAQRANGLRSMIKRIQAEAAARI
jgi:cysteine desulfuration protein SufE